MYQRFEIQGRLDGLNEHDAKNRGNRFHGASSKKSQTDMVAELVKVFNLKPMTGAVNVNILWYEGMKPGGKRFVPRDKDNIRHGIKYILDGLVKAGILQDDSWNFIGEISDSYFIDKDNPRIVIELTTE